jgi:hypothetical protein
MDQQLTMLARIRAFEARHGGKEASSVYRDWIYYSDGANRDLTPEGLLQEPLANEFERQQAIVYYYRGRLQAVVTAFNDLKEKLKFSGATDRDREQLIELKKLQAMVTERNAELQTAQAALSLHPIAIARAGAQQFQAEQALRIHEWQAELAQLKV